jgi:predicted ATPase
VGGAHEPGIAELQRGLELSYQTGAHMDDTYYLALLADAHARAGQIAEAWAAVEAGLALAPAGRGFFFESELHRTAGQLLLLQGRRDEAQSRMHEALEMARSQGSPSLELRAALSLARHLRSEGADDAARGLVAGVYATFTEGSTRTTWSRRGSCWSNSARSGRLRAVYPRTTSSLPRSGLISSNHLN